MGSSVGEKFNCASGGWASGNGGTKGDSCSTDGYINSIFTLAVSAANAKGRSIKHNEPCAATHSGFFG